MRIAGDTLAFSPPLVITRDEIGEMVEKMGKVLRAVS
jgi:beta-alanine--pyruvate transaminase